jgi:ATP-dependent 26S proteasome regulatory subunit
VLFFDEIDMVASKRDLAGGDADGGSGSGVGARVLTTLLAELDGVHVNAGEVLVIAATSRLDALDSALTRPGRLGAHIYVGLPDYQSRREILVKHAETLTLDESVLDLLANCTDGLCGAELRAVTDEAKLGALRDCVLRGGSERNVQHPAAAVAIVTEDNWMEAIARVQKVK